MKKLLSATNIDRALSDYTQWDMATLADLPYLTLQNAIKEIPPEMQSVVLAGALVFKARKSPADYAEVVSRGYFKRPRHINLLNEVIVDATKRQRFVIVSLPVRLGKSFLISEHTPAWYLGTYPDRQVIQCSYSKDLAVGFSRKARDIFTESSEAIFNGLKLREDSKAAGRYHVQGHRGSVLATGVGSAIIGMGADLIVMDDPYKDAEQAFSATYKKNLREWWTGALRSRLEPGGSIILVMARWSEDDLAGWLLEQAKNDIDYDPWVEIKVPALCMDEETDVLGRKLGEAVWAERYDEKAYKQIKASSGALIWNCQYQQSPINLGTTKFPAERWQYTKVMPDMHKLSTVRFWDLSAGGKDSDYVVGALVGFDKESGLVYVLDIARDKFVSANADIEVEEFVKEVSQRDRLAYGKRFKIVLEKTAGAGKAVSENYVRKVLAGFNVEAIQKAGDKMANAIPLAAQQQAGNVFLVCGQTVSGEMLTPRWIEPLIEESLVFGSGSEKNDDQVDAISGAYNYLVSKFNDTGTGTATSTAGVNREKATIDHLGRKTYPLTKRLTLRSGW